MPVIPFIIFIVAAILFFVDFYARKTDRAIPLGLTLLTVGFILLYTVHGNPVSF